MAKKKAPARSAVTAKPKVSKLTPQQKSLADAVAAVGSQAKLAKKLDCSQQSVSAWLKGERPRGSMQRKLKKMFNVGPWAGA